MTLTDPQARRERCEKIAAENTAADLVDKLADALEHIDGMTTRMEGWAGKLTAQAARIEALEKALRDFAKLTGCLEPGEDGKPACDPPCMACAALG